MSGNAEGHLKKVQVLVCRPGPQYLMLKLKGSRGGYFQPVTGSAEKGERFEDAAVRELEEETGLTVTVKRLIDLDYEFTFRARGETFREKAFGCFCGENPRIRISGEHESFQWAAFDAALDMLHWESNRKSLRKLHSRISHIG